MTKVSYIDLLPTEEEAFYKNLTPQSRYIAPRITKKNLLVTRRRIAGLRQASLLPQVAAAWNLLTQEQKDAWTAAGGECDLNGYRLFVQDKILRIKNELSGNATPSLFHQSTVGALEITEPASELQIIQLHPHTYWVYRKVGGRKGSYQPVLVTEDLSLPLSISLNYKSELTSAGGDPFAKFYAEIWHSYQGQDLSTILSVDLDLSAGWKTGSALISYLSGYVVGYTLFFHLHDVRGMLYFDNVKAEHSGQNWVRDPFCKDIDQGFTKAFYQIPKNWAAVILPSGSDFASIYKNF